MLILNCLISITTSKGLVQIPFANRIEIESSWKDYTDTCRIMIAKKIFVKGADFASTPIQDVIASGNPVEVKLGYDGVYTTEFKGYVNYVHPKVPLVIECEDEMWKLKRTDTSARKFSGGKISSIIKHIAPGYTYDILDSSIGGIFRIDNDVPTPLKVLEKIKDVYGLYSFFRLVNGNPVLVVGKQYLNAVQTPVVKYIINENVIHNGLEYRSAEDVYVKVRVRSRQEGGKVLHNTFTGDSKGDLKSLTIPGLSQSEVEAYAHRLYDESKTDRMEGSITTFGLPLASHGQIADINTRMSEIKHSRYYIDRVATTFGVDGFRRVVEFGAKAPQS
ncbi:MAG: hypothetical protein GC192_23500 [Bacteroidetes bacterium]|nr:hypothetical protein [Bacteroidota bacterium]